MVSLYFFTFGIIVGGAVTLAVTKIKYWNSNDLCAKMIRQLHEMDDKRQDLVSDKNTKSMTSEELVTAYRSENESDKPDIKDEILKRLSRGSAPLQVTDMMRAIAIWQVNAMN